MPYREPRETAFARERPGQASLPDRFEIPRHDGLATRVGMIATLVVGALAAIIVWADPDGGPLVGLAVVAGSLVVALLVWVSRNRVTTCRVIDDELRCETRGWPRRPRGSSMALASIVVTRHEGVASNAENMRRAVAGDDVENAFVAVSGDGRQTVLATGTRASIEEAARMLNRGLMHRYASLDAIPAQLRDALTKKDLGLATRSAGPLAGFYDATAGERRERFERYLRTLPVAGLELEWQPSRIVLHAQSGGHAVVTTIAWEDAEPGVVEWSVALEHSDRLDVELQREDVREGDPALAVLPRALRARFVHGCDELGLGRVSIADGALALHGSGDILTYGDPATYLCAGIELAGDLAAGLACRTPDERK